METIRNIWAKYYSIILGLTIGLLGVTALSRLAYQFARLAWLSDANGAIDLKQRYDEVQLWFAGEPIYSKLNSAVYPPASYTILWPFLGYPSVTFIRWFWAVTSIAGLFWLAYLLIKQSQAKNLMEKLLVVGILLAMYPTGDTVGNGQLCIHVLVTLVAGLTLMCQKENGWGKDLLAGLLVIVAFVKPTLAIPFFWIVLFVPGRLRPALIVIFGYLTLALVATAFQESDIISLHRDWLSLGIKGAAWSSTGGGIEELARISPESASAVVINGSVGVFMGYGDIHSLLGMMRLNQWNFPVSLVILFALGYWTYVHRRVDLWLLLGVVGIISRIWTYHRVYDDLLIILPTIALFRMAKQNTNNVEQFLSSILFAMAIAAFLVPSKMRLMPLPWSMFFKAGQPTVWIIMLIFLVYLAWHQRQAAVNRLN